MSKQLQLWVYVIWLNNRPLGLGAQRLIGSISDFDGLRGNAARPM